MRLLRALLGAALVLTSGSALAGPVVVAVAAAGAGAFVAAIPSIVALGAFAAAAIGAAVAIGVSVVLGGALIKPGRQQEQPTFQAEMRDRTHVVRSSVEARRIVYGEVMVSGPLGYAEVTGSSNQYLHMVIPVAGHEVKSIDAVYLNDELVPLDSSGLGLGRFAKTAPSEASYTTAVPSSSSPSITLPSSPTAIKSVVISSSGQTYTIHPRSGFQGGGLLSGGLITIVSSMMGYLQSGITITFHPALLDTHAGGTVTVVYYTAGAASYVRVNKHLGASDQAADADLVAESGGQWTSAHRLRGVAYVYVRLEWSEDVFPTGIPNVKAVVRGKKLVDPRQSPSVAWSDNWALVLRDYLTASYGLACDSDEIDESALAAAASICDEAVPLVDGSPTSYAQKRYSCNGTINLADRPVDIIQQLCTAAAGAAIFTQGVWKVVPGAYVTPSADIDESWLAGPVRVLPRKPRRELYNAVRGVYSSADRFWQPTDFPPVENSTYATQDGGEQIWRDIEQPFVTDSIRAQRIAKIHLEKSRQGARLELPCNLKAFGVAVWDTVRVSIDRLGYDAKVFQVLGWRFDPSGKVMLTLQEEASAVYDWANGDATAFDPAPDTTLPNPFDVDLSDVTASSGTADLFRQGDGTIVPRVRLRWTAPANPFITHYELQFSRAAGSPQEWVDAPDVAAPASEGFCHPVQDGVSFDLRVRAVTTLGNAGAWSYVYGHTVIGKTELPSDVIGASAVQSGGIVVMGCNEVTDADLDAIEVRLHDEGETDWDNASPIKNILRGQTQTDASIPPGTWELLFKTRDTSGNYSQNAARVSITVTADGFTTIEEEPQAVQWLGTRTNMVKHWTGVLTPESQSLASDLGWEVFDEFVPNAYTDCYYEAPVIDKGVDAPARIFGDIVSVLGPGESSGVAAPALEVDARLNAGAFDGFEVWSVGAANFRYLKARLHVDTTIGKPVISQFTPTIDGAAREETGTFTTPAGGSVAVTFGTQFHETPVGTITPQGSGDVTASYANLSTTGFDGYFKTGGAAGAGTASYRFTGA